MTLLLTLLALGAYFWWAVRRFKDDLHILQLNGYFNGRYLRWLRANAREQVRIADLLPLAAFVVGWLWGRDAFLAAWGALYALVAWRKRPRPQKKPLVMTFRATRLYGGVISVPVLAALIVLAEGGHPAGYLVLTLMLLLAPLTLVAANTLAMPLEHWVNAGFYRDAQRIVKGMPGLTVIGVTGSYGKTSTKFILGELLGSHFSTLVTPESFNTPMGVTRTIRDRLRPIHQMFVAEMGAKQRGDIKELCRLASPMVGVLTAIGEQHLETFGSLENVRRTKAELIAHLPAEGLAVLNGEDENVRAVMEMTQARRVLYGIHGEGLDYRAEEIQVSGRGSRFTVVTPHGAFPVETRLLGEHNILNILAGIAVASELGVPEEKIARAARALKPAPHRLQLIRGNDGVTVIDDAFNANPVGVMSALTVLGAMEGERKILITPGLIELGERHEEINRGVGERAAEVADYVILVGPRQTQPIRAGLEAKGWPADRLHVARNLDAARAHLNPMLRAGDVVLFENDLPDTFAE